MTSFQELEEKKQKFLRPLFSLSSKLPALLAQAHDPDTEVRIQLILKHFPPALEAIKDFIAQQLSIAPPGLRPTLIQQETFLRIALEALRKKEPRTDSVHDCLTQIQRLSENIMRDRSYATAA